MRTLTLFLAVVWLGALRAGFPANAQSPPAPVVDAAGTEMVTYYAVLLRRGPTWAPATTPELAALSKAHMDNIQRLTQAGRLVVAGPFLEQSGERALAGLFILRADSLADARALTDSDPAVKAGRFVYEILPWMGPRTLRY